MGKILPQIEHVVLVMFENRSLDNVLGWLYADQGNRPGHNVPPRDPPAYNGLDERIAQECANPLSGSPAPFPIVKGTCGNGLAVPGLDPYEEYEHVNNQLFGDSTKRLEDPEPGTRPRMRGFLQDFQTSYIEEYTRRKLPLQTWDQSLQILQTFTPDQLPVLNGLARAYAVSDRWFSSVPTQTNPNRAFVHCGTSLGRQKNKNLTADEQFFTDTIWNVLAHHGCGWAIYYHDSFPPNSGKCYTVHTFPHILRIADAQKCIRPIAQFWADIKAGKLPAFTFLEPKWGWGINKDYPLDWHIPGVGKPYQQGNDYHPPTSTGPGEEFLQQVYEALVADEQTWRKTLLIVTFDEHGGTFDHEPPPWGATPPDDIPGDDTGFKFDRFGVRVPTLLVTPYVREQTVFRSEKKTADSSEIPYDHTSIIATVLKWRGIDPSAPNPDKPDNCNPWLGRRVAAAPTLENVLQQEARPDRPRVAGPRADQQIPITIRNETPAQIYVYLGWLPDILGKDHKAPTAIWGNIPHGVTYPGCVAAGESVTYDTQPLDRRIFDYYVQASYWVGSPKTIPADLVDAVVGVDQNWRQFWKGWRLLTHHQTLAIRAGKPQAAVVGPDSKGRIRIVNNSLAQIFWKVGWGEKVVAEGVWPGRASRGYLDVGEIAEYDTNDWQDHDYWVQLQYWTKGFLPGVTETWNSVWPDGEGWHRVGRNATVTVSQAQPTVEVSCP